MGIRDAFASLRLQLRAAFAWKTVEINVYREVERNDVTGAYRWRHIDLDGVAENNGPWYDGAPRYFLQRALCETETTLADVAQMLAPEKDLIVDLAFGTDELTGYALRRPDGTVITWRHGEEPPPEAAHLIPSA